MVRARILFFVVACSGVLSAQGQLALSGLVTDAASGAPISGAVVTVSGNTLSAVSSTVSQEGGRFRVAGLPPGRYRVRVSKPGFVDTIYGSTWKGEPGRLILLSVERPAQSVAVALRRHAVLFGELRDG